MRRFLKYLIMKKIVIFAVLCMVTWTANAQNLISGTKFTDNWSIGINGGGITPLTHSAFFKNMRPTVGVELDKQLTPVFGLGFEGMWAINATPSRTAFDFSNVSALAKVNLNNLFGGYRGAPRVFEIEAVTGAGWLHYYVNGNGDANFISTKLGLNFNFNLGSAKAWTIAVKPALVYNLEGDNHVGGYYNANIAAVELTAGLIYHFKGSNGKHHMTLAKPYNQMEVDGLNAKINELRTQLQGEEDKVNTANQTIEELQTALNDCRNKKPVVQTVTNTVTNTVTTQTLESVVTFRQGKTTIDASQLPNVERIATYMNNHPTSKVTIKGYASPEGSAEINAKIAQQRADAVKEMLIKKYRIAASRIDAEGQGVGDMFSEPDWNRVSICTLDEAAK